MEQVWNTLGGTHTEFWTRFSVCVCVCVCVCECVFHLKEICKPLASKLLSK